MKTPNRTARIFLKILTFLVPVVFLATAVSIRLKTDAAPRIEYPAAEIRVISRALHFIANNYVDPELLDGRRMMHEADRILQGSIPPLVIREREKKMEISAGEKKTEIELANPVRVDDLPSIYRNLLGFINGTYQGSLKEDEREQMALEGMVETLDPHSNFLSPKVYNEFKIGTKGNFGGLGIVIGMRDGYLSVIAPLEGTPAWKAGIKAKDRIAQIGEEATINMSLTEAVERLRGPVGSKVTVGVQREGVVEPLHFSLTRDLIQIQSVAGVMVQGKRIGLLKMKNFQEDTFTEMNKQLEKFRQSGPLQGLILDLRNNPGGLLDQAVRVSDQFLSSGVIVKTVGPKGTEMEVEKARAGDPEEQLPIVILVNEGSASASEIVAGALQYNNRAIVIGNRTFGKGSVQTIFDLKDGSALKLTVAKYRAGGDHEVQSVGIMPDLKLLPAGVNEKKVDLFEGTKRRESDLEGGKEGQPHLQEEPKELPPSPFELRYLTKTDEDAEEEKSARLTPEQDFPVQLAAQILELPEARSLDRQKMLKGLPDLVRKAEGLEDEKVAEAMKKIGIDWSVGEKKGLPRPVVRVELLDEKGGRCEGLKAGESGFIRLTVENKGNGAYSRLVGVTKSEDPLFDNLEFPIGRLGPGEHREWKAILKIPELVSRRGEGIEVNFHEQYDRPPSPARFDIKIEEPPPARFQYSYEILGKVAPGEKVGLKIHLTNSGVGESAKTTVNLKSLGGEEVFVEKGRSELGKLAPGGSVETTLFLHFAKKLPDKLPFEFSIHDARYGRELIDRIELPVGAAPTNPPPGVVQQPPVIELADLPLSTRKENYEIKGKVKDDKEIRHLFIIVGDEKVFYRSPSKGDGKESSFETTVKLKKGLNPITVTAEDDREVATRERWIVWRN